MPKMRPTEIDFDVHKLIEQERRDFDEPDNQVLRRLLAIDGDTPHRVESKGRPWSGKGVSLPHGTLLQMQYNGSSHSGMIDNGEWSIEGSRFKSPSAAAGGVARTRSGGSPSLDGWLYWQVKRPGDKQWHFIKSLREDAQQAVEKELLS